MTEDANGFTSISASLGELEVEVEGEDLSEVEEVFEDVWRRRLEETSEMTDATRMLRRGYR